MDKYNIFLINLPFKIVKKTSTFTSKCLCIKRQNSTFTENLENSKNL